MPTAAGADDYSLHKHDEDEVLLSSNDEEAAVKAACAASHLCRDPNNDTEDYRFCLNCNVEAHLICTEQMDFQTPALDKFVINHHDFSFGGKERYKKTPRKHRHQVVFCLLCKARMLQKKMHPTKKLESAPRKKKGKFGPPAVLLRNLRKQLQEVGSEERVCNPIVLSVLSNIATSMGLSSLKTSGETESDYND
jgi:hypothetical protein